MTASARAIRVLVAEDSPTQAAELQCILEDQGFEPDMNPNGRAALEKIRAQRYDLVLSDVMMPEMGGYDLCRAIKSDPRTSRVPVILLTTLNEPTDIIRGLESGADNYLIKPYEPEDLLSRIDAVLSQGELGYPAESPGPPIDIAFEGKVYSIRRDRRETLAFFTSVFEDFVRAKQREWEVQAAEAMEREKHETAAALARAARELMSSLDSHVTLKRFCQLTAEILGCDRSQTFLWDAEAAAYVPSAGHGVTAAEWQLVREVQLGALEALPLMKRLEQGDVVQTVVPDGSGLGARSDGLPNPSGALLNLYVPLRRGSDPVGFQVASYRRANQSFSAQQRHIFRGMAEIASLAFENARLHEELDGANRLKIEFVSSLSHELRTPLETILGYAQLLHGQSFGSLTPKQVEGMRRMEANGTRLAELLKSMLDLSRLERGEMPLTRGVLDVGDLVCELEVHFGAREAHPDVEVVWAVEPNLPTLYTDAARLRVTLEKLIDNALKFTEKGRVTVSARGCGDGIEFAVADTGIGIPAAVLPVIFECFRRVDTALTRHHGGVGIGLYVAKRLTSELGGRIQVESEPGKGSTFLVRIPREIETEVDQSASPTTGAAPVPALSARTGR